MKSMRREAFELLVQRAIQDLPAEFRDKLENVAIIVESQPSPELLERMEISPEDELLGLYEGVPLTERGFDSPLYPDRIWIFQKPIEASCESSGEIMEQVKITLVHEVAHFFGLNDDYLEELGY
jgi:predicted Zn-dependent protease with MMP-like domain